MTSTTLAPSTTSRSTRTKVEPSIYTRTTADGDRFEVDYRDRDGKQRRTSAHEDGTPLRTLTEARARREALKVGARRREVTVRARVHFADYAREYLAAAEGRKRTATFLREQGDVENHLVPRLGRMLLADLDADTVADLVADLSREGKLVRKGGKVVGRSGLAAHSVRNVLGVLSRIMSRAVRAGLVPTNPVALLEASERPKADHLPFPSLTEDDLDALLAAVADPGKGRQPEHVARDLALVWVTMTTGLRQSEVLGLRWRDVDMDAGVLHVRQAAGRYDTELKTRASRRSHALHPEALRMLASLSLDTEHGEPDDYVFATRTGTALGQRNVLRIVERARELAGLNEKCDEQGASRLTFHGLRHVYASVRLAHGDPLADVSAALGHTDIATTSRIYAHEINASRRVERDRASVASAFTLRTRTSEEVAA